MLTLVLTVVSVVAWTVPSNEGASYSVVDDHGPNDYGNASDPIS